MSEDTQKTAVNAYDEIDLSVSSEELAALLNRAETEARSPEISLSTEAKEGTIAAGLTPAMQSWLQSVIIPKRTAAISEAQQAASRVMIGKSPGILDRVEIDKKRRHRAVRQTEISANFRTKNSGLLSDYEQADQEYEYMRFDEGGRDAKVPNHFFEWMVLLPLIMIPESMLNFESFRRAPIIQSDFQALGVTILVGIGIAIAAHYIGRFIRQFSFFMRADDNQQNRLGWPMWSIGLFLLIVSLGVVGYARYYYLLPQIDQALMLGRNPPNILLQTGSLLLGNLVVFLIGAAITFLLHDRNPDFSDKHRKLKKLRKRLDAARNKEMGDRLSELDRAFGEDTKKIRLQADQMARQPSNQPVKSAVSAIDAKDGEVMGALGTYREKLAGLLNAERPDFAFKMAYAGGNELVEDQKISIADFQALQSRLLWVN